ncbi:MAG: glycosyltransferase family 2 protein [Chloroflexota bacterium]
MNDNGIPKVSIGLPVYNGANFLAEALDAILAQTYRDFEVVIVDNASEDATPEICRAYAEKDSRIHFHQNEKNIGAADNYNLSFELARGEYFRWAAHDDLIAPTFLERCVEVLDQNPDVVLCFTRTIAIDGQGNEIKRYPSKQLPATADAQTRFRAWVVDPHPVVAIFGLMRREVLAHTRLIGKYSGSDRPLLSEMSLLGRLYEVPEFLFFYRVHESQSWGGNKSHHAQQAWYDPRRAGRKTYPHWRLLAEHTKSISRTPLDFQERVTCYGSMLHWVRRNWRPLYRNLLLKDSSVRMNQS